MGHGCIYIVYLPVFTRDSIYAIARAPPFRLSVCHTRDLYQNG